MYVQAEAKRLAADVKRLANDKDGLDCLVGGMQAQIDELSHNKGLLEVSHLHMSATLRLLHLPVAKRACRSA